MSNNHLGRYSASFPVVHALLKPRVLVDPDQLPESGVPAGNLDQPSCFR